MGPAAALPEAGLDLSAREVKAVEQGEVVVRLRNTHESTLKDVLCVGLVKATADRIWNVLIDYDRYDKIFKGILKTDTRSKEGPVEDHYSLLDYPWPMADRWVVNRITHAADRRSITWHRVDGTVKEVVGSWHLVPDGDETLVIYKVRLDPGIPLIPAWAIDWGTQRVAPDIIHALRRQLR
ncbi:Polyketide cyclase / dehydrase and lipid transport [compost metagenome]